MHTFKTKVEFSFRLWVHPEDGVGIETWYQGLEPTGGMSIAEWARCHIQELGDDVYLEFGLDREKYWQVVGKATLRGWYDYFGEYDEEFDVIEFQKEEVAESKETSACDEK